MINKKLLTEEVQKFIDANLGADVHRISLAKSPFEGVTSAELATQIISKAKCKTKLPTWFSTKNIYYPPTLSIEQTSSENTAKYKTSLLPKGIIVDLTAGLGVDSYYFSKSATHVFSCEVNEELSKITAYNAKILNTTNITCLATDGLEWLKNTAQNFDAIYLDPARRNNSGKVFKLADCTPNVVKYLPLLFSKTNIVVVKTAPLLDLQAGIIELKNVAEIHIVSVKNECKELLWVLEPGTQIIPKICCVSINETLKKTEVSTIKQEISYAKTIEKYLYEPDAAVLKSGAFDWVAKNYNLQKLATQSHLYTSNSFVPEFMGRIFAVKNIIKAKDLKANKNVEANVIARNYPLKAEDIVKKFKILPSFKNFMIFTKLADQHVIIDTEIIRYY